MPQRTTDISSRMQDDDVSFVNLRTIGCRRRAHGADQPLLAGGLPMQYRGLVSAIALAGTLTLTATLATAFDDTKSPDVKGQWVRVGPPNWQPVLGPAP